MEKIAINEFKKRYQQNDVKLLVDVRSPAEFESMHVVGAVNLPLSELTPEKIEALGAEVEAVYFICRSGARSQMACESITNKIKKKIISVEGGTNSAVKVELPISYGNRNTISLERQVRIVAGAIVLLTVILGVSVSPMLLIVTGFVGAGLMFAGITDWCGMALLLEKMPWNKASSCCHTTK